MKKLFAEGGKIVAREMSPDRIDQLMPMGATVTPKDRLSLALKVAWQSYIHLFGEPPHGTLPQMKALVAFIPDSFIGEPAKPGITIGSPNDGSGNANG